MFESFLDLVVLGELFVFCVGGVNELAEVKKCLMIGVAPIPDLGVDLVLRLGVGRLALELVEKKRILIDLHLKLGSIGEELRVHFGGVVVHEAHAAATIGRIDCVRGTWLLVDGIHLGPELVDLIGEGLDGLLVSSGLMVPCCCMRE